MIVRHLKHMPRILYVCCIFYISEFSSNNVFKYSKILLISERLGGLGCEAKKPTPNGFKTIRPYLFSWYKPTRFYINRLNILITAFDRFILNLSQVVIKIFSLFI